MRAAADLVFVLGGSSLIGRFLLPQLDAAGAPYRALSRHPGPDDRWLKNTAERLSPTALPRLSRVISLAPIWVLPAALPALHAVGMRRLVAVSSTSRFTKATSADAAEREIAVRIATAEETVIVFCEANGVRWTILRPTMIYSEGHDANVSRLARVIRRLGVLPLYGAGQGRRQPVHAEDLATGVLAALQAPAAENRAFDTPGGETLSYREMCVRVFRALRRPALVLSLPPALWRAAFRLAAGRLPGAGPEMGARMAEDMVFDGGPARDAFGWNPRPFRPVFGS